MFVWQWAEINESNVHDVLLRSVTALSLLTFCVIGSIFLFCLFAFLLLPLGQQSNVFHLDTFTQRPL